jgi:hypothetical protein
MKLGDIKVLPATDDMSNEDLYKEGMFALLMNNHSFHNAFSFTDTIDIFNKINSLNNAVLALFVSCLRRKDHYLFVRSEVEKIMAAILDETNQVYKLPEESESIN